MLEVVLHGEVHEHGAFCYAEYVQAEGRSLQEDVVVWRGGVVLVVWCGGVFGVVWRCSMVVWCGGVV